MPMILHNDQKLNISMLRNNSASFLQLEGISYHNFSIYPHTKRVKHQNYHFFNESIMQVSLFE